MRPWTDAAAQQVLGGLKFDADNTLRETPVLDMVRTVGGMLERERATRARPAASAGVLACLVEGLVLCTHHWCHHNAANSTLVHSRLVSACQIGRCASVPFLRLLSLARSGGALPVCSACAVNRQRRLQIGRHCVTVRFLLIRTQTCTKHSSAVAWPRRKCSAGSALSQLLLIVADGRFHERDALARAVRAASGGAEGSNGLLIVFILPDTDSNESVLELQSVTFENGTPVFKRYLDEFPFPYYLVLRDIEHLPRLLADVLRQWLQLCAA